MTDNKDIDDGRGVAVDEEADSSSGSDREQERPIHGMMADPGEANSSGSESFDDPDLSGNDESTDTGLEVSSDEDSFHSAEGSAESADTGLGDSPGSELNDFLDGELDNGGAAFGGEGGAVGGNVEERNQVLEVEPVIDEGRGLYNLLFDQVMESIRLVTESADGDMLVDGIINLVFDEGAISKLMNLRPLEIEMEPSDSAALFTEIVVRVIFGIAEMHEGVAEAIGDIYRQFRQQEGDSN